MCEMLTIDTSNPTAIKVDSGKILYLVPEDATILHEQTIPFSFEEQGKEKAQEYSRDLTASLKHYKGFGLSANQCGIPYSVLVMGAEENYATFFNPKIIESTLDTEMFQEGCLSYPGLVLGISRPKGITISFQDEEGNDQTMKLEGLSARIMQHEIDHLNGITFNKVTKPLALKTGMKKREKYMKTLAKRLVAQRKVS